MPLTALPQNISVEFRYPTGAYLRRSNIVSNLHDRSLDAHWYGVDGVLPCILSY